MYVSFGSKSIDKKNNGPQINAKAMTFNDGLLTFSQEIAEHAETAKSQVYSRKSRLPITRERVCSQSCSDSAVNRV